MSILSRCNGCYGTWFSDFSNPSVQPCSKSNAVNAERHKTMPGSPKPQALNPKPKTQTLGNPKPSPLDPNPTLGGQLPLSDLQN